MVVIDENETKHVVKMSVAVNTQARPNQPCEREKAVSKGAAFRLEAAAYGNDGEADSDKRDTGKDKHAFSHGDFLLVEIQKALSKYYLSFSL